MGTRGLVGSANSGEFRRKHGDLWGIIRLESHRIVIESDGYVFLIGCIGLVRCH